jgi:hypothetical protein
VTDEVVIQSSLFWVKAITQHVMDTGHTALCHADCTTKRLARIQCTVCGAQWAVSADTIHRDGPRTRVLDMCTAGKEILIKAIVQSALLTQAEEAAAKETYWDRLLKHGVLESRCHLQTTWPTPPLTSFTIGSQYNE